MSAPHATYGVDLELKRLSIIGELKYVVSPIDDGQMAHIGEQP